MHLIRIGVQNIYCDVQIIQLQIGVGGNGTQKCDASVQKKNFEKKCDIRDNYYIRTLTPNPTLGLC